MQSCEGDTLVFCSPTGQFVRYDCIAAGWAGCSEWSDLPWSAACHPPGERS
jgi:hypothetical protein